MTVTFAIELSLMFFIAAAGGILALVDGITRTRGGGAILAVLQIIASVLFLLSLFVRGIPLTIGELDFTTPLLGFILVILLLIQLAFRGSTRRGGVAITLIAIVLLIVWFVFGLGARLDLYIPGVTS